MSQLDVSITFNHFCGLIFCFYIFLYYMTVVLMRFWYNYRFRSLENEDLIWQLEKLDNAIFIKRILKL